MDEVLTRVPDTWMKVREKRQPTRTMRHNVAFFSAQDR